MKNRAVWTPLVLLVLCLIADMTFLRLDDVPGLEIWSKNRMIGVPLVGLAVILTTLFTNICSKRDD